MNIAESFAREAFDKSILKLSVICLSVLNLVFAIFFMLDISKDPVVIERACESKFLSLKSSSQTKEEVEAFVTEAVKLRFDSKPQKDPLSFMVQDLLIARSKEQEELNRSGIDQRLIIRSVNPEKDGFLVEADRLIKVKTARSALPTTLLVKVASKPRSLTNPYGLILTSVEAQKAGGPKDE